MDTVRAFRDNRRENKVLKNRQSDLADEAKALDERIRRFMESGDIPQSVPLKNDGGGNVHLKHEVWVSVPDEHVDTFHWLMENKYDGTDFDLTYTIGNKPNTQSLSAFMRERLDEDTTKDAIDRLRGVVPDDILACLKVSDKHYINANGL